MLGHAHEARNEPDRESGKGDGNRRDGQPVECDHGRQAEPQDPRPVALEQPLLPELEGSESAGDREAGERGEDEAHVRDEQQVVPGGP